MRKLKREILRRRVGNRRLREVYHRNNVKPKKSALMRALTSIKKLFRRKK